MNKTNLNYFDRSSIAVFESSPIASKQLMIAFVLFFIRWALEASVKLTEWAVGLLTLIVGAAIIYSIVIHRGDLFLYSLIFAGILAILMAVVVVQDFCSSMLEKINML